MSFVDATRTVERQTFFDFKRRHVRREVLALFVTAKVDRGLCAGGRIAGQPVVLPHRKDVMPTVLPERFQIDTVGVERRRPAEGFKVGDVVDVPKPTSRRHVFVVA